MNPKIFIAAGGTGGHVFPGLALAHALRADGCEVAWLGTSHGLERRVVTMFPFFEIEGRGLRGQSFLKGIRALGAGFQGVGSAYRMFRRERPDLVVGMGGYVGGIGGLAAGLCGLPLVIHEQNAVLSLSNRILSLFADRLFSAYPEVFHHRQAECIGNPLPSEFFSVSGRPSQVFLQDGIFRLLVLGGSQGASFINTLMPEVCARLKAQGHRLDVLHQAGMKHIETVREDYHQRGLSSEVRVQGFIDSMVQSYTWADAVVARSGALTVTELCALGVPSLLIPFPHATSNHQQWNALALCEKGGANMILQDQATPERVAAQFECWIKSPSILKEMALQASKLARPAATEAMVHACWNLIRR